MADPVTIMLVASSAMQAVGAIQQGKAAEANAQSQANAARYNAQVKEMQAGVERQQANVREDQQRRKARQILGQQQAAVAQSGTGFMGSNIDVIDQSSYAAELDALTIRYEGEMRAKGLLAEAEQEEYYAKSALVAGKNAKRASYVAAGSALLSGAAAGYKGFSAKQSPAPITDLSIRS